MPADSVVLVVSWRVLLPEEGHRIPSKVIAALSSHLVDDDGSDSVKERMITEEFLQETINLGDGSVEFVFEMSC